MKRTRGTGSLFKRGKVWWFTLVRDGRVLIPRTSANTTSKSVALEKLQRAIAEVDSLGVVVRGITVADLIAEVLREYRVNGQPSLPDAEQRWKDHLQPALGNIRAVALTTDDVNKYVDARLEEGAANGTINRELSLLKHAYILGMENTPPKVRFVPAFKKLPEDGAIRKNFLTDEQYTALSQALAKRDSAVRTMFEVGYAFGLRDGEVKSLRVRQVDLAAGVLVLEETKNGEMRTVGLTQLLRALLGQCIAGKAPDDYVFTWQTGNRVGQHVADFRGTWSAATAEAGVKVLFHDLRRTAIRNMIRSGISETVAMRISGHKTRAVFDRYNITSERDLLEAARKIENRNSQLTTQSEREEESKSPKLLN